VGNVVRLLPLLPDDRNGLLQRLQLGISHLDAQLQGFWVSLVAQFDTVTEVLHR
jgi:hypothetical protein